MTSGDLRDLRHDPPGDQPLNDYSDRDAQLIKTLSALIESIKELRTEMSAQRAETVRVRQAIENCDACRPGEWRRP